MDKGHNQSNFIVDRFYTAIGKSRQLEGSDYIRGDLAVVPAADPPMTQAWGKPWQSYGSAATSLNLGALSVMAGPNESDTTLSNLVQTLSEGASTIIGGVPYPVQSNTSIGNAMGSQKHMKAARYAAQNTISAPAF